MKIAEVASRPGVRLSPLKARVLGYLQAHPDEVFSYRDRRLADALAVKLPSLDLALWSLHREGLIDKQEVDRRVYFGSRDAVAKLRERRGVRQEDPFEQARAIRDRIHARTGPIDVLELLDAVRGPWD